MANKLLCQQLKNIIRSLKDNELEETLKVYEQISKVRLEKVSRMISYKCYEASIVYKGKKANGYGRNEQEAIANCTKNVFEFLLEEEPNIALIMQALKKDLANTVGATTATTSDATGNKIPRPETGNHQRFPSRTEKFNNSLALNLSIHQNGDTSFDMKGDIETLSKNIGNISIINNSRVADNPNVSQLEMDDFILKTMLENPDKAKNFKEHSQQANPMGLGLKKHGQPVEDSRGPEQKKVLSDNTNYQHLHQRRSSYSKTQPIYEVAETSSKNDSFNKENNQDYDNRDHKIQPPTRSNSALNRSDSVEPEFQKTYHGVETKQKQKCVCGAEEELAKSRLKIEALEKKLKALTEENKALKNQSVDVREKENMFKSTDAISSASTQLTSYNKSTYEKSDNQPDIFSHHESISENVEKQPASLNNIASYKVNVTSMDYAEKQRSHSVDVYSKRKAASTSNNDASGEQSSKIDIKKMIPRLRLDMLPNYHLKNQKGSINPLSNLNPNAVQTTSAGYSSLVQASHQQSVSEAYQSLTGGTYSLAHSSVSSLSGSQKLLSKK